MAEDYQGAERRRFQRVQANFTVIYKVDQPLHVRIQIGDKHVEALVLDLSEGGMCMVTNYDIPASTIMSIKFILIDTHAYGEKRVTSMQLEGEVRYNLTLSKKEHRLGIRFADINEYDQKAIADFVKRTLGSL